MEPFYIRRKKGRYSEELTFNQNMKDQSYCTLTFFLVNKDWIAQKIKKIIKVGLYLEKII